MLDSRHRPRTSVRALAVAGAAGLVVVLAASPAPSVGTTAAATKTVTLTDDKFTPKRVTIRRGSIIRFRWAASAENPHNVKGRGFSSGQPQTSGTYRRKFRKAGRYRVVCQVHPAMRMRVTVRR
jgi:plastocyanin